jgi:uncharacterized membrane protein
MDALQVHTLLNHYPMIGSIIGMILLIIGLWRKNEKAKRVSLWIFCLVALLILPIYATGEIAGANNGMTIGTAADLIKQHRATALIAFALIEATGIAAFFGLILLSRSPSRARWTVILVLVLSIASTLIVTRTTLMGRQIKFGPAGNDNKAITSFER